MAASWGYLYNVKMLGTRQAAVKPNLYSVNIK
jgi:hypothetical protein